MNRIIFSLIISSFLISGCNKTEETTQQDKPLEKKVWVFAQFNVPEEGDEIDSYWYFGMITESEYGDISANRLNEGFLRLTNVHYWGDDNSAHAYEDDIYDGEMIFKMEDLRKITRVKRLPVIPEQQAVIVEKLEDVQADGS